MKKVHKCAFIRNGNYATASRLLTAFFEKIGRDPVFRNERKIPVFANTSSASCKVACAAAKISTGWGINRDVTHHVTINLRKSQVTTFFARRKSCDQGCQPEVRGAHLSRDVTRVRNYKNIIKYCARHVARVIGYIRPSHREDDYFIGFRCRKIPLSRWLGSQIADLHTCQLAGLEAQNPHPTPLQRIAGIYGHDVPEGPAAAYILLNKAETATDCNAANINTIWICFEFFIFDGGRCH